MIASVSRLQVRWEFSGAPASARSLARTATPCATSSSEHELGGELNDARITCSTDCAESGRPKHRVWREEWRRIRYVEHFRAQLQCARSRERHASNHRDVQIA